jgi:hypothetical protein
MMNGSHLPLLSMPLILAIVGCLVGRIHGRL